MMVADSNMSTALLVLSGGEGRRMDRQDKGLVELAGKPLILHVLERFQEQVDQVLVSCHRHAEQYRDLGYEVVEDADAQHLGPLAGLASAAGRLNTDLTLVLPCDMPALPGNLLKRLQAKLEDADACLARVGDQDHFLVLLLRTRLLATVGPRLQMGDRSVRGWLNTMSVKRADFSNQEQAFINLNSTLDLHQYSSL